MDTLPEYVRGYVAAPRETFQCELKPWLDHSRNEMDRVKIAKACLALRNSGGGLLLIGRKDDGTSDTPPVSLDIGALYNQDEIQRIVSSFAGDRFQVDVVHIEDGETPEAVAIVVPGGVTTPTMCTHSTDQNRKPRMQKGVVYVRTYDSNKVISSAPANQNDMQRITKLCHDNRVAEIGQFLRRHLEEGHIQRLAEVAEAMGTTDQIDAFHQASKLKLGVLRQGE